ncbi:MAG: LysE family translocator [Chloroflexota bacterium]
MLADLVAFAGAALVLAMVPGPSTVLVLRQTLRGGRGLALTTTLGNATGLLFWSVAAAFGLSALVAASQAAYDGIKVTGAIVLIVLGAQSLLRSRHDPSPEVTQSEAPTSAGSWAAFRLGLLTNLANPKAAVFALSFLPQFVPPHAPVLATILLLALIQVIVDVTWYALLAWFVNRTRLLLSRPIVRRRLEQASGVVLIGFGLRLAVEHR